MPLRPDEADLIDAHILPALTGTRRFLPTAPGATHLAFAEIATFQALLSQLRPRCAVEIGTQTGVTLAEIARHSTRVISLDIDPEVKARLDGRWPHVELITGNSHTTLGGLFARLAAEGSPPDFIFVDGDHTAEGVRLDLEHVLALRPTSPVVVLMHDSFNPQCRRGMLQARWAQCRHCHYVELDFVPGVLHPDPRCLREMWGGLGYALLLPEPRTAPLEVHRSHQLLFEAAFRQSVYAAQLKPAPARG